jgi:cytochrome c oxidase assembly protein subunit 11
MASAAPPSSKNARVGLLALGLAAAMLALGYAAVPLYRLFCQVTGFAGTTQVATAADADKAAARAAGGTVSVRFDANASPDIPWTFKAEVPTVDVKLGQRKMAFFMAHNNADVPVTGAATFNVSPEQTGYYFNKIQCFCFTEQTLQPGQTVRMPVLFYVDPAIRDDPNAAPVEQITLSYTFHRAPDAG